MDSFNFTNLQAEKANAMLKYRKLRKIASMLRFVEVCVVLVFISRLPLHLPVAAVKNSSEYFRDLSIFVNSPRFVFLIGNAIIITLFAQSGQFSAQAYGRKNNQEPDLYQEFIQNTTKNQRIQEKQNIGTEDSIESEKQSMRTEDSIKNRRINGDMDKSPENHRIYPRTIKDYSMKKHIIDVGDNNKRAEKQSMKTGEANIGLKLKSYRRCGTEIVSRVKSEKEKPRQMRLRRCETEKGRKSIESAPPEEVAGISYPEDHMSNEEFRLTVEAFIARQQRLRREEDYFIV